MTQTVTIARQFNGPDTSGNGGYSCGVLARFIDGPAEATLRAPPPLDTLLTITRDGERVLMHRGELLLGEAKPAHVSVTPPPAPTRAQAELGASCYVGHHKHILPHCFVCGGGRTADEGLRIFAGPFDDSGIVACPWTPAPFCADAEGLVSPDFIWAALDCPTYWALPRAGDMMALLARLSVSIDAPLPRIGEKLTLAAWPLGAEGRKHRSAAALYDSAGTPIARAEALWIELKSA